MCNFYTSDFVSNAEILPPAPVQLHIVSQLETAIQCL